LLEFAGADVHHRDFCAGARLRTSAAEFKCFLHLGKSLGPVLCVRSFERKIAELLDAIGDLLVLLQRVVAILILLRLGIVRFLNAPGQIVKSLRIIGVGL
jgi:hypothetical protein